VDGVYFGAELGVGSVPSEAPGGICVSWSVACLTPNGERRAVLNLERQGFTSYSPRCRVRRKVQALFPNYLFVKAEAVWRSLMGTRGIARVIMNGERPGLLPPGYVEALRAREGADGVIDIDEARFQRGQAVRLTRGVMEDCEAIYDAPSGAERCYVLLSLLGRPVRVQVEEGSLAAA
jgi:transcription elongation factor/antiterminator RfaH